MSKYNVHAYLDRYFDIQIAFDDDDAKYYAYKFHPELFSDSERECIKSYRKQTRKT